ncbi:hypothetical protein [Dietzia sp. 179-F 9C3 NHS]
MTLPSSDSDATARALLTSTSAREMEIARHFLDDAFVALTGRADRWEATA